MDDKIFVEYYKVTRNSVEHFDKLLAHFRQIMFAFNGIFISTGIKYFVELPTNKEIRYIKFFLISNLLVIINIMIWLLEKHYHRYLIASAGLANEIERKIFPQDQNMHLTYRLSLVKKYRVEKENFSFRRFFPWLIKYSSRILYALSSVIRTYDLIYLLPIVTSLIFNFFLGCAAKTHAKNNWLLFSNYFLIFVYLIIGFIILAHNFYYENSSKMSSASNSKKQNA